MDIEEVTEIAKLNGMIWWLATELATDDVGKGGEPETWIELAEKHWPLGIRAQTRFLEPATNKQGTQEERD